ncbi:MAG: hypothetical protein KDC12_07775, partial [Flavobacteriales bacterium]|nr:hypothetical protein [Flavobacteriales bacterium]
MKKVTILSILALSIAFLAFRAANEGDLTKVSVVHHANGQVMVMDTVFDPATGYSVEQFLLDHGLNPQETEIINTDELKGTFVHNVDNVWFMNQEEGACAKRHQVMVCDPSQGNAQDVRIEKTVDDQGNVVIKQFINGEEVEGDGSEMIWISEGDGPEGGQVIEVEGDGSQIFIQKVAVEGGEMTEEEIEQLINQLKEEHGTDGEEPHVIVVKEMVSSESQSDGEVPEGAETIEVEVEKFVGPDGEEQIQMWINGEEVDPAEYVQYLNINEGGEGEMEIEIEILDGESENVFILSGDEVPNGLGMQMMQGGGYTLAIVSSVSPGEQVEATDKLAVENLAIENLTFSPNPNTGQFQLSFNLPE